ncbi:YfiR family protein [Cesiribacter sp. SM1]|uniref:YfiR family protein n=1 Tax=Cesiribacter sp. SM1 TaxID=2861196 RepID=UPI001CD6F171|nr:YfiR family protein [Cesiribacter sp. SM1]
MKKARLITLVAAAFILLLQHGVKAQGTDYKFHTVFIYNFTKYIKWPDNTQGNSFVIGVLGKSGITTPLKEMAASKTVNGKPIEVVVYNSIDEIKDCHMIFLPSGQSKELAAMRTKLANSPTLIISEKSGLAEQGSAINFILNDGRWKFEVNQATTDMHGLKISQELLKFALKVYTEV